MMGLQHTGRLSPRSKMGAKWLSQIKKGQVHVQSKDNNVQQLSVAHLSPLGSQSSFNTALRIEDVVDWDIIRKKYLSITGNETDKDSENQNQDDDDNNDNNNINNNDDYNQTAAASSTVLISSH